MPWQLHSATENSSWLVTLNETQLLPFPGAQRTLLLREGSNLMRDLNRF
jgi:hypothetical protein